MELKRFYTTEQLSEHMHETSEGNYCRCGCGMKVAEGRRFVSGHNTRKYPKPILNHHLCECGCGELVASNRQFVNHHNTANGLNLSADAIKKMAMSLTGKKHSQEDIEKRSISLRKVVHTEEWNKRVSEAKKGISLSKEHRYKLSLANLGKKQPKGTIEKRLKSMHKSLHIHPNKPETIILNLLNVIYPNEWKFTGDFSLIINGKNPDFVNVNGQKKIIELAGDYWHEKSYTKDRAKVFKPFGYKTLVIWEHELKNIERVTKKIKKFAEMNYAR